MPTQCAARYGAQLRSVPAIWVAMSGSSAGHMIGTEPVAPVAARADVEDVEVVLALELAAAPLLPGAVTAATLLVVTPVVLT